MNKNDIFKIGIGTRKVDPDNFEKDLETLYFGIEKADYEILNNFQNEKINSIEVNWEEESGVTIDQLANQNEEENK